MNAEETGRVLAKCASYDNRKIGDADVIAWYQVLSDLPYSDCIAAVIGHYTDSPERIMPAHVRGRVKAIRRDRLAREIVPAPSAELADEPGRYKAALQAKVRQIADGKQLHLAIGRLPSETPPDLAEVRQQLGPAIPPPERLLAPEEIARRQAAESRAARGGEQAS